MESQASQISVEQSQADRSKRHYEPIQYVISLCGIVTLQPAHSLLNLLFLIAYRFDITAKEQAKITVGRLHFRCWIFVLFNFCMSETTQQHIDSYINSFSKNTYLYIEEQKHIQLCSLLVSLYCSFPDFQFLFLIIYPGSSFLSYASDSLSFIS